jgi:enoyl-CoA hydratase/carnithine racemase
MTLENRETSPILQREDRGAVSLLTLNRPAKLNALSNDLLTAIVQELDNIELDPMIRVIMITGAIHRGMDAAIDDGLAIEEAAFARIVPTHDAREGVAAFLEKRAPRFLGR